MAWRKRQNCSINALPRPRVSAKAGPSTYNVARAPGSWRAPATASDFFHREERVTARSGWLSTPSLRFHYLRWGSEGSPVVLLHGLASTCRIWELTAPSLASACRVWAPDQRGHGLTDKPTEGYDFPTVVEDLRSFLAGLGIERPLLVGHSWGAGVALHYAATWPQETAGLVLVDGGTMDPSAWSTDRAEARRRLTPPDLTHLTPEELRRRVTRRLAESGIRRPGAVEAVMACFREGPDGRVRPRLPREQHMQVVDALLDHRPSELYPRVRCPVLLVPARWPQREGDPRGLRAKETGVARALALLPAARAVWLDRTVHDVPLQRPDRLAELILEHAERVFGAPDSAPGGPA